MIKPLLFESFSLFTDFVMHLPLSCIRNLYAKIIFKEFGKGSQLARHVHLIAPYRISIGKNVFINRNVTLDGRSNLTIGDNTDIGEYCSIWTLQHDIDSPTHATVGKPTIVESHCWIAPRSIILPGVKVGRGGVIATNSVVTKDTEECVLVAGAPAKTIRRRQNDLNYELRYKIYL